jgi:hypothetical protein
MASVVVLTSAKSTQARADRGLVERAEMAKNFDLLPPNLLLPDLLDRADVEMVLSGGRPSLTAS